MIRHILLRMGQDAWLLAAATLSIMALSMTGAAVVVAAQNLFGVKTNDPQWVIVAGYIAIVGFPFWLTHKWYVSAKKRVIKKGR